MKPINVIMVTGAITKTSTLATNFHNPVGGSNPYVRFGYGPLAICYHTQGQVSGSINADPINMIHTIKQSTEKGLNKDLEGYFRSSTLKIQRTILYE